MKVLFIVPEIRLASNPIHAPFWAGILAAIVEQKGGQVGILDLNALRTKYGEQQVPSQIIIDEISSEKWDMIGIGGLTTTYGRIKELSPIIRKYAPQSLFIGGGGWSTYNPQEILHLVPEMDLMVREKKHLGNYMIKLKIILKILMMLMGYVLEMKNLDSNLQIHEL